MLVDQERRPHLTWIEYLFPEGMPRVVDFILGEGIGEKVIVSAITPNPGADDEHRYAATLSKTRKSPAAVANSDQSAEEEIATMDVTAGEVSRALEWLDMKHDELNPLEGHGYGLGLEEFSGCGYNSPESRRMRETGQNFAAAFLLSNLQLKGLKLSRKPAF